MKNTLLLIMFLFIIPNGYSSTNYTESQIVNLNGDIEFPPFTNIAPNVINTDTPVLAGIDLNRCWIPSANHFLEINGNEIKLFIELSSIFPCTVLPVAEYYYYNLGTLPEGQYTITFYDVVSGQIPVAPNDPNITVAQIDTPITFGVNKIQTVPSITFWGLGIMFFLFFVIGVRSLKIKFRHLLFSCLLVGTQANAVSYHVLLSGDPNAPTADAVKSESLISPAPPSPVLSSFISARPQKVDTLISQRVTGNFLNIINNNPDWSYSKLYRYIVLSYPEGTDEEATKNTLLNDQYIDNVFLVKGDPSIVPILTPSSENVVAVSNNKQFGVNSHLTDLNIISAWELSEGSGYIGALDTGLQVNHPSIRAFDDSGNYVGGNLLDAFYQFDIGEGDFNIDEAQPISTLGLEINEGCDLADGNDDNFAVPEFVGHGTHVAGLMSAKGGNVSGICKNCGLSMVKFYFHNRCLKLNNQNDDYWWLAPLIYPDSPELEAFEKKIGDGLSYLVNIGMGVTNYSGGISLKDDEYDFCLNNPDHAICLAITQADEQNVLIVGANGNHRTNLQLPAADPRTIAVGGLNENGNYWNESPLNGDYTQNGANSLCPYTDGSECGSNKSFTEGNAKTDVVTQARSMYSTFYNGKSHNPFLNETSCTDELDGIPNDGYGLCTGTSMSSPQVASILQLMRSTNPLLPNGNSDPTNLIGLKNILNHSSSRTQNGSSHNEYFGYGLPDARLALETILGKSNDLQMKTRLTPMFNLVSNVGQSNVNNIYTSFPQVAVAFLIAQFEAYLPDINAPLINEFTEFWYGTSQTFPAPRASFYVFTTNNNPFTGTKNLTPLRRMEKTDGSNRNDTYAINNDEIETFHADGYNYAGIEGYVLPACSPVTSCAPTGSVRLFRDETDDMNHKLITIADLISFPPVNSVFLGFVYENEDSDGDGLIDGQERILGTSINSQDSDGDTIPDGVEYPAAGVPYSDPMISDIIFKHGFE